MICSTFGESLRGNYEYKHQHYHFNYYYQCDYYHIMIENGIC